MLEAGETHGEKKLDLEASKGQSSNTCSGGGYVGRRRVRRIKASSDLS